MPLYRTIRCGFVQAQMRLQNAVFRVSWFFSQLNPSDLTLVPLLAPDSEDTTSPAMQGHYNKWLQQCVIVCLKQCRNAVDRFLRNNTHGLRGSYLFEMDIRTSKGVTRRSYATPIALTAYLQGRLRTGGATTRSGEFANVGSMKALVRHVLSVRRMCGTVRSASTHIWL